MRRFTPDFQKNRQRLLARQELLEDVRRRAESLIRAIDDTKPMLRKMGYTPKPDPRADALRKALKRVREHDKGDDDEEMCR